jgi:hypothetical protein
MTMLDERNSPDEGTLLDMDDDASPPPSDVVMREIERSIQRLVARGVDPAVARAAYGLTPPPDPLAAGGAPSLGPQVAVDPEGPATD